MIRSWLTRYGRRRRLVAAAFAALSVLAAFLATRPATSAPTVLVASRDLAAGPLDPADFHPAALVPPPAGAVRALSPSSAQTLAAPMRRGEPLTDARLLSSYRLPPGLVATPVRISDPAAAALLSPGSTITLLASYAEGVPARQIAPDSQVLTIPKAASSSSSSDGSLIVLATTITQAAELATAQAHARLSITIKPNPG
ncbi:flagellar biosynthesis protein FlgA [Nonomuraea sp. NPDC048882]|uniref:flagellar biosynthesis protein FlgA n=1 Tax=Nonomuraea sp. NPDC048882 TaxID=3154347 RepID=UPI0033D2DC27